VQDGLLVQTHFVTATTQQNHLGALRLDCKKETPVDSSSTYVASWLYRDQKSTTRLLPPVVHRSL
jgi:hypothetical protein